MMVDKATPASVCASYIKVLSVFCLREYRFQSNEAEASKIHTNRGMPQNFLEPRQLTEIYSLNLLRFPLMPIASQKLLFSVTRAVPFTHFPAFPTGLGGDTFAAKACGK